jgi:lycopene beta-cyclase
MNAEVSDVGGDHVTLADGSVFEGLCVIDARGPSVSIEKVWQGYQKFVGLEVETEQPWPERIPTVMDATVPQDDGYRFLYTLPFDAHRVLVEDTYFSDGPVLDRALLRERVAGVMESRGIGSWRVLREESGVLPMPWAGGGPTMVGGEPIAGGAGGGWFHPATGYSFPLALRLAMAIGQEQPREAATAVRTLLDRMRRRQEFARFLNRLLFGIVVPKERWRVFRRLYRDVPDAAMARFYAMEFTAWDAARMVVGWPPPLAPLRLFPRWEVASWPLPLR